MGEVVVANNQNVVSIFDFSNVDTILYDDMSIGIKVEDAANILGLIKVEKKKNKEYRTVRMDRINKYSKEYGFDHIWSKGDYIPESFFYWLAFKIENEKAIEFRKRFSLSLRDLRIKTYVEQAKQIDSKEILQLEENFRETERVLNAVFRKAESITIRMMAKLISSEGRSISERGLRELLKMWKILLADGKEPSQWALEKGILEYRFNNTKKPVALVSQKGQLYILKRIFRPHLVEKR